VLLVDSYKSVDEQVQERVMTQAATLGEDSDISAMQCEILKLNPWVYKNT
jgi:hypothetical protein